MSQNKNSVLNLIEAKKEIDLRNKLDLIVPIMFIPAIITLLIIVFVLSELFSGAALSVLKN